MNKSEYFEKRLSELRDRLRARYFLNDKEPKGVTNKERAAALAAGQGTLDRRTLVKVLMNESYPDAEDILSAISLPTIKARLEAIAAQKARVKALDDRLAIEVRRIRDIYYLGQTSNVPDLLVAAEDEIGRVVMNAIICIPSTIKPEGKKRR